MNFSFFQICLLTLTTSILPMSAATWMGVLWICVLKWLAFAPA